MPQAHPVGVGATAVSQRVLVLGFLVLCKVSRVDGVVSLHCVHAVHTLDDRLTSTIVVLVSLTTGPFLCFPNGKGGIQRDAHAEAAHNTYSSVPPARAYSSSVPICTLSWRCHTQCGWHAGNTCPIGEENRRHSAIRLLISYSCSCPSCGLIVNNYGWTRAIVVYMYDQATVN